MEEIFNDWKKFSEKNEEDSLLFIKSLKFKDSEQVDRTASELHVAAFTKIDCLECGNCCRTIRPVLDADDINQISTMKSISVEDTKRKYLMLDEDNEWTTNSLPCPFLGIGNKCEIYESRPKDCREYPHTDKPRFASRSYQHSSNTTVCPAAHYIVKNMQKHFN